MTTTTSNGATARFTSRLSLEAEAGVSLGDTRVRLLEEIDRLGSISQAAKAVPLSYKAAWDAIDTLNNLSPQPVVTRLTGGRQGGGTQLTDYGRRVVAMYRALESEYQGALERVSGRLEESGPADIHDFQALLHRLSMKVSARNQFSGPITALRDGGVDFEVSIRLDLTNEIVAVITKASAENLGLAVGKQVYAFVKSSSVMLSTDAALKMTARNQLWGKICAVHEGAVNDEVLIKLPGGRTVTSVVTHGACEALGLAIEQPACALFKSSSVILASYV